METAHPPRPGRRLAVLTCMDGRLPLDRILGIKPGDAHLIRNAGGLATDDAIRSLVISQRVLGTEDILVLGHSECGMLTLREDVVRAELAEQTGGVDPALRLLAFDDLDRMVLDQVERLRAHPWINSGRIRGLIYEIATSTLREPRR
jgi:carbonic anhydrase